MKKIIPIFFILALLIVAGFGIFIYKNEQEKNKVRWKVEILHEYINVRDKASTDSTVIGKAYQGNVYNVLSVNLDHHAYVWYEIEYRKGQIGWIASERNIPYVKEYNNPNLDVAFVTYTTATPEMVDIAKTALKNRGFKTIYETTAGATISSHCGENTLGILYLNETED